MLEFINWQEFTLKINMNTSTVWLKIILCNFWKKFCTGWNIGFMIF